MNRKRTAVLGIGSYFKRNHGILDGANLVICYADNDKTKWGTEPLENGIVCVAPEQLKEYDIEQVVIGVEIPEIYHALKRQAEQLGFQTCSFKQMVNASRDSLERERRQERERVVESFFENTKPGNRLILLNTPQVTSTIGDHAISTAEVLFIKKNVPEKEFLEIGDRFFWEYREEIKRYIYPSDVLLIQGGGYLGSLWRMWREDTVRYILQSYPDNQIIVLPQTMFFEKNEDGERQKVISETVYNSNRNLTMCFREKNSYQLSEQILQPHVKRFLIPDIVTSMEGLHTNGKKNKIAVCFKNDKETLCDLENQERLIAKLKEMGHEVEIITMFYSTQITSAEERELVIRRKMEELAGYEMVITDAMHGMVLSAVSGTACVGVESITGKVGGVYHWLEDLPYVEYTDDVNEILTLVQKLAPYTTKNNSYVNEKVQGYFAELIQMLKK